MSWRFLLSVAAALIVASVIVLGWPVGPMCPATSTRTSQEEITHGALTFVAAELQLLHDLAALATGADADTVPTITAALVAEHQPDCCKVTRTPPEAYATRTEQSRTLEGGPEVHAYFNVAIDAPALLPPLYASYDMIVSVDVCGAPVQDWLDLSN